MPEIQDFLKAANRYEKGEIWLSKDNARVGVTSTGRRHFFNCIPKRSRKDGEPLRVRTAFIESIRKEYGDLLADEAKSLLGSDTQAKKPLGAREIREVAGKLYTFGIKEIRVKTIADQVGSLTLPGKKEESADFRKLVEDIRMETGSPDLDDDSMKFLSDVVQQNIIRAGRDFLSSKAEPFDEREFLLKAKEIADETISRFFRISSGDLQDEESPNMVSPALNTLFQVSDYAAFLLFENQKLKPWQKFRVAEFLVENLPKNNYPDRQEGKVILAVDPQRFFCQLIVNEANRLFTDSSGSLNLKSIYQTILQESPPSEVSGDTLVASASGKYFERLQKAKFNNAATLPLYPNLPCLPFHQLLKLLDPPGKTDQPLSLPFTMTWKAGKPIPDPKTCQTMFKKDFFRSCSADFLASGFPGQEGKTVSCPYTWMREDKYSEIHQIIDSLALSDQQVKLIYFMGTQEFICNFTSYINACGAKEDFRIAFTISKRGDKTIGLSIDSKPGGNIPMGFHLDFKLSESDEFPRLTHSEITLDPYGQVTDFFARSFPEKDFITSNSIEFFRARLADWLESEEPVVELPNRTSFMGKYERFMTTNRPRVWAVGDLFASRAEAKPFESNFLISRLFGEDFDSMAPTVQFQESVKRAIECLDVFRESYRNDPAGTYILDTFLDLINEIRKDENLTEPEKLTALLDIRMLIHGEERVDQTARQQIDRIIRENIRFLYWENLPHPPLAKPDDMRLSDIQQESRSNACFLLSTLAAVLGTSWGKQYLADQMSWDDNQEQMLVTLGNQAIALEKNQKPGPEYHAPWVQIFERAYEKGTNDSLDQMGYVDDAARFLGLSTSGILLDFDKPETWSETILPQIQSALDSDKAVILTRRDHALAVQRTENDGVVCFNPLHPWKPETISTRDLVEMIGNRKAEIQIAEQTGRK